MSASVTAANKARIRSSFAVAFESVSSRLDDKTKPMSAVKVLLILALLAAVTDADILGLKKECPEKPQPPGDTGCLYYCDEKSEKYGIYPNGSSCDYTGSRDGNCTDGLCYPGPDSVTPTAVP